MIFLGILLDGNTLTLVVPQEKKCHALNLLRNFIGARKAIVKQLQSLAGLLNFLNRAITPGRAFTRRMYAKFSGIVEVVGKNKEKPVGHVKVLKPHHHVNLDMEFRNDCLVWEYFLTTSDTVVQHPFVDMSLTKQTNDLAFYSDAAKNAKLGFGAIFQDEWMFGQWGQKFMDLNPSIEFLELFGLVAAVFAWSAKLSNQRVRVSCDNQSVVYMVNDTSSSCPYCMKLIHLLTLQSLQFNLRIFAKWARGVDNDLSDALSRMEFNRFWKLINRQGKRVRDLPTPIPRQLWPPEKFWTSLVIDLMQSA